MPTQRDVFLRGEADAWFLRNRAALAAPERAAQDPVLRLTAGLWLHRAAVLEVGCADGWRLAWYAARGCPRCVGVEPSAAAVAVGDGREGVRLRRGHAAGLEECLGEAAPFGLVVVAFVLHWLSLEDRAAFLRQLPRYLAPGAWLAIADFLPDRARRVPYHHRAGLWTYKADYGALLAKALDAELLEARAFSHDEPGMPWRPAAEVPSAVRCAAWLLRAPGAVT
jgi:SAM-dependent methyltransferase